MILLKKRLFILLTLFTVITFSSFGQDPHFSQFYANPLYLNPAFTGTINCPRFSILFRDQWPAIKNNFITSSISYDQYIYELHGGIGVLATADIQGGGIFQTYNAGIIYNFRAKVSDRFNLQFALQGNYLYNSINLDRLVLASDLLNPQSTTDVPKELYSNVIKSQFDAGFGMIGYTPYLFFGLAIHHLLPLQLSYLRTTGNKFEKIWEPKWTAHVGGKITISQKFRDENNVGDIFLYPTIVFQSQGNFNYMHEGFYFNFYPFTIGAWVRHNFKNMDAFILSFGVEYKIFKIGYSYDFNLTKLEGTGGAHEVSLQFIIPCNKDRMSKNAQKRSARFPSVECPSF